MVLSLAPLLLYTRWVSGLDRMARVVLDICRSGHNASDTTTTTTKDTTMTDTSHTYYEITATHINDALKPRIKLFGSYVREDVVSELELERDVWRDEGFRSFRITTHSTDEAPDPEVYTPEELERMSSISDDGEIEPSEDDGETIIIMGEPVMTETLGYIAHAIRESLLESEWTWDIINSIMNESDDLPDLSDENMRDAVVGLILERVRLD